MTQQAYGTSRPRPVASRLVLIAIAALGLVLPALGAARAQPVCLSHDELARLLDARYQELRVANAIANNGALVELYANADHSTWTLAMTRPGGLSCVLVAGEGWNYFPGLRREQMVEEPRQDREHGADALH